QTPLLRHRHDATGQVRPGRGRARANRRTQSGRNPGGGWHRPGRTASAARGRWGHGNRAEGPSGSRDGSVVVGRAAAGERLTRSHGQAVALRWGRADRVADIASTRFGALARLAPRRRAPVRAAGTRARRARLAPGPPPRTL